MRRRFFNKILQLNITFNYNNYLTIEALEDGLTASLSVNDCEYCVDGDGNWKSLEANTLTESINAGQILSFRGILIPLLSYGIGTFTISKTCNLKGNCMSMLFKDNAANNYSLSTRNYAFSKLFKGCTTIKNATHLILPATTLSECCYYEMFRGCSSLITTPSILPASELYYYCYYGMFYGCTSLTTASKLPATTLNISCYALMFNGCTSLTTAPELPAITLADECYLSMFYKCFSLTAAPELPATTLADGCYYGMFSNCTSLTTAPELPATTLAKDCYYAMFAGCSKLTTAPKLLPATTLVSGCYGFMFENNYALTTAPKLPATTLADKCYNGMFYNCYRLENITMLATDISASNCLVGWVRSVASTGTFTKHEDMTSLPTGTDGIPSGWTVQNYYPLAFSFNIEANAGEKWIANAEELIQINKALQIVTRFMGMQGGDFSETNAPLEFDLRINGVRRFSFYYDIVKDENEEIDIYISLWENENDGWYGFCTCTWNNPVVESFALYGIVN